MKTRDQLATWKATLDKASAKSPGARTTVKAAEIAELIGMLLSKPDPDGGLTPKTAEKFRKAAKRLAHEEGVCEVDEDAAVSASNDQGDFPGAYVATWLYIPASEIGLTQMDMEDDLHVGRTA